MKKMAICQIDYSTTTTCLYGGCSYMVEFSSCFVDFYIVTSLKGTYLGEAPSNIFKMVELKQEIPVPEKSNPINIGTVTLKPKTPDETINVNEEFKWVTIMDNKVVALFSNENFANKFTIRLQELFHKSEIETRELV